MLLYGVGIMWLRLLSRVTCVSSYLLLLCGAQIDREVMAYAVPLCKPWMVYQIYEFWICAKEKITLSLLCLSCCRIAIDQNLYVVVVCF